MSRVGIGTKEDEHKSAQRGKKETDLLDEAGLIEEVSVGVKRSGISFAYHIVGGRWERWSGKEFTRSRVGASRHTATTALGIFGGSLIRYQHQVGFPTAEPGARRVLYMNLEHHDPPRQP